MNAGAFAASIFGPALVVEIVSSFGWRSVYLVFSAIGLVLAIIWYVVVRNRPTEHPWVSREELDELAADAVTESKSPEQSKANWRALMRQRSFWALALGYFATLWCVQFFIYWLPYYLQVTQHVSFRSLGIYASLPWISIVVAVLVAGVVSDFLLARGCSRFIARNMLCATGLLVATAALLASTTTSTVVGNVLWISLALGMAGVAQTLSWTIVCDIGGRSTSIVGGWMNMWGFIAGSIVPTAAPIVGKAYGWNAVIVLNACVTMLGVGAYILVKSHRDLTNVVTDEA